eukprot:2141906-Prorocentrum_lima.AAC.1
MTSSLVGSEMCIRDRLRLHCHDTYENTAFQLRRSFATSHTSFTWVHWCCLLYTSDAADDM